MKEHIKNNLPEGWAWAKIDQLVEINYGKGLKKERRKGGTFPVYGSNGIVGYHNAALTRGPTIILGRKGSIGAIHYSANSCWPIDTTYFVDEFNRLDSKYLEHALRSLNLAELDTSTAIPGLNRNDLYDQYLPLAPFPEQKRIVAKVEQLIARVKATKERLAKASMILKRFRQAVLSAACSGRLTSDLRQKNHSRKSGEDLLELILNKKETSGKKARTETDKHNSSEDKKPFDLPTTWAWATIGQITKNFDGERIPVKADDRKRRRGRYDYYGASGIIDSIDDYLFDGEFLLIAEDGANLLSRSTPIAFRASGKFWVNNHAHIVQTYGNIPLQYLEGYLNSIDLQNYVTGSAQPKLTQEAMNRIPVPLPPNGEQKEIVGRVEGLFKLGDGIEKRVAGATLCAEKITRSILAKAFRGELAPTEAELARREGRPYESASELLARIKSNFGKKNEKKPPESASGANR